MNKKFNFDAKVQFSKEKYLELFHQIDWNELKRTKDKIILVDTSLGEIEYLEGEGRFTKMDLLNSDSFIYNVSHPNNAVGSIIMYKVLEKILVENNHLIVITENFGFNSISDELN